MQELRQRNMRTRTASAMALPMAFAPTQRQRRKAFSMWCHFGSRASPISGSGDDDLAGPRARATQPTNDPKLRSRDFRRGSPRGS